eukprot:c22421_g2_i1 orf=235-489(+)
MTLALQISHIPLHHISLAIVMSYGQEHVFCFSPTFFLISDKSFFLSFSFFFISFSLLLFLFPNTISIFFHYSLFLLFTSFLIYF